MPTPDECTLSSELKALRCKVELLEDRISRQQFLVDELRHQSKSLSASLLPQVWASANCTRQLKSDLSVLFWVGSAVLSTCGVLALGMFGK